MIKKFNENWRSHNDSDSEEFKLNKDEKLESALKRAKSMSIKQDKAIKFDFEGKKFIVTKYTDIYRLEREFEKSKNKEKEPKFKVGDHVVITKGTFANNHDVIKRISNGRYTVGQILNLDEDSLAYYKPIEVEFQKGKVEIVGLPSGQVIYMSHKQAEWFKSRGVIKFHKTWKKPVGGGYIPIEINKFCFEDPNYKKIIDMLDTLPW